MLQKPLLDSNGPTLIFDSQTKSAKHRNKNRNAETQRRREKRSMHQPKINIAHRSHRSEEMKRHHRSNKKRKITLSVRSM